MLCVAITPYLYKVHSQLRSGCIVIWPMRVLVVQRQRQRWDTLQRLQARDTAGLVSFRMVVGAAKLYQLRSNAASPCMPPRVLHLGCRSTARGARNCRLG
jgi:hypothetical protein